MDEINERYWLASEDPASMLTQMNEGMRRCFPDDRRFSLWEEACRKLCDDLPDWRLDSARTLREVSIFWLGVGAASQRTAASLLREIVGNPFRPVTLDPAWRTPIVLSLATAAYEERGRRCYRCGGNKTNRVAVNRDHTKHQDLPCSDCNGTGTIDDGTLDNDRLAVLSDALEEAGCDDEAILSHLRTTPTDEHSPRCGTAFRGCAPECPKDRWERQGPHVRGCHVIDLILVKE